MKVQSIDKGKQTALIGGGEGDGALSFLPTILAPRKI